MRLREARVNLAHSALAGAGYMFGPYVRQTVAESRLIRDIGTSAVDFLPRSRRPLLDSTGHTGSPAGSQRSHCLLRRQGDTREFTRTDGAVEMSSEVA